MSKEERVIEIRDALLEDDVLSDPRWDEISVVFSLSKGGRNFGNGGYAYGGKADWWAVSFPITTVQPAVIGYLKECYGAVPDNLIKVLFQYNRRSHRLRVRWEMDQPELWMITPENARKMVDVLRPNLHPNVSA